MTGLRIQPIRIGETAAFTGFLANRLWTKRATTALEVLPTCEKNLKGILRVKNEVESKLHRQAKIKRTWRLIALTFVAFSLGAYIFRR